MRVDSLLQSNLPMVSIVIPVFNGANFFTEAVKSALAQTYSNLEIIVVNDGSNDNGETERIAQSFGSAIRYFVKPNGGVASALNLAIREMKGDYFSWLSHDDLYSKDKIEQQIKALPTATNGETIIYSDYSIFSDNPAIAVPVHLDKIVPEQFRCLLTISSALHGCTLLIPRVALEEFGGFNEKLRTTQDYDLWFRLSEKYRFIHIREVLVKARNHSKQGSTHMADVALMECNNLFSGFIKKLSANDVASIAGQNLGAGYLAIASSMWKRGYEKAGICAGDLARQCGVSSLRIKMTRSIAVSQFSVVKLLRQILSPRARQMIRGIGRRMAQEK